ncbi:MAG: D-alanyl-D-alanine carboxypeptidase [Nitratireductor sp.]|nr:D-alanyl-D-alanine carboxypeptidase [Nitratireductor sp.]
MPRIAFHPLAAFFRIALAASLALVSLPALAADTYTEGPYLVIDAATGGVLAEKNATDRWYPASLTKLMTTYVALREVKAGHITLQSPVRISPNAEREPPSKMGFPWKTVLTVDAALKILMVKSANDVATAVGESVGGSEAAFAGLMNHYARDIGMRDSHWVNAHGLHSVAQYTSARDLAVLAKRLYDEFPAQRGLFNLPAIRFGKRVHRNHNGLLREFPGTTGMKTGFICAGGVNIVASATRGGRELIAVVLGHVSSNARNSRAAELLSLASARSQADFGKRVDQLEAPGGAVPPRDITEQVCRKQGRAPDDGIDYEDAAIELYPITRQTLGERHDRYLSAKVPQGAAVAVALNGATGPDPFNLLVEQPPMLLALETEILAERPVAKDGKVLAIPTRKPVATASMMAFAGLPGDGPFDPALLDDAVGDDEAANRATLSDGTVIALPTRRPQAYSAAGDDGNVEGSQDATAAE